MHNRTLDLGFDWNRRCVDEEPIVHFVSAEQLRVGLIAAGFEYLLFHVPFGRCCCFVEDDSESILRFYLDIESVCNGIIPVARNSFGDGGLQLKCFAAAETDKFHLLCFILPHLNKNFAVQFDVVLARRDLLNCWRWIARQLVESGSK